MSVYSSLQIYPSEADDSFNCKEEFCKDCTFDCWKEPEMEIDFQYEIYTIFHTKGFHSVNWNYLHGKPCLTMYLSETKKFVNHMKDYGYTVIIGPGHNRFWATVFIHDEFGVVDPKDLMDIFRAMEDEQ